MVEAQHPLAPGDYVGCVAGHLRAAVRVVTREYDSALRPHGVRITQVAILAQLARLEPATVTVLAESLSGERSALARDVAILERAGLVAGAVDAGDRRARPLSLTPAGRRKLAECAPAWHAVQARVRERLGDDDVTRLLELSGRLVAALA